MAAVYVHSGWSKTKVVLANFISSLSALVGAIAVLGASEHVADFDPINAHFLLFAAGLFCYISLGQLLPEISRIHNEHNHGASRKLVSLGFFGLGCLIIGLLQLYPHSHGHSESGGAVDDGHGH